MIKNLPEVRTKHKLFQFAHKAMVMRVLNSQHGRAKSRVRTDAGFRHVTLTTLKSTKTKVMKTRSGAMFRISNYTKRARWLELGTAAHDIVAKRKDFLVFWWEKAGFRAAFRSVHHPGTKPYYFMRNAARHVYVKAGMELRAGMRNVAQRF